MYLSRSAESQRRVDTPFVVSFNKLNNRLIGFGVRLKLLPCEAFHLEYRMKRLNVSIFVGRLARNSFVYHAQPLAHLTKSLTYELRSIIRANNGSAHVCMATEALNILQRQRGILAGARQTDVVVDDHAIVNINNGLDVEKPTLTVNVTVLDIRLKQLVWPRNGSVPSDLARPPWFQLSLRSQDAHFFA